MSETPSLLQDRPHAQEHPCLSCGACCAHYRVCFHWREGADAEGAVPLELCQDWNQTMRMMCGTERKPCRCVALSGSVGIEWLARFTINDRRRVEICKLVGNLVQQTINATEHEQHTACDH